jgi:hypothetical protein
MKTEEIIRLVFSFLGGGLVAGILAWVRINRADRIGRRVAFLRAQIEHLYAPLHFFAAQNRSFFELNDKLNQAYTAEFVDKKWSNNKATQENIRRQADATLELANKYISLVTKNNDRILEILRDNFAYIDDDDVDTFRRFLVDYTRMRTELDPEARLKTPFLIYKHVGEISFMRPEFIEQVESKFREKRKKLASYR